MHPYNCKLMLFAVSFVSVLAGCGASAVRSGAVPSVSANRTVVVTVEETQVASASNVEEVSEVSAKDAPPVSLGMGSRNRGTCWFVLTATGEKFCSKDAALAAAAAQKLADRRVEESCFGRDRLIALR